MQPKLTHLVANRTETATPVFGMQSNPLGRLSMIRYLELDLRIGDAERADLLENGNPLSGGPMEYIEKTWSNFIHQSKMIHDPDDVCFSALETLKLDFSTWGSSGENLEVSHTAGDVTQIV